MCVMHTAYALTTGHCQIENYFRIIQALVSYFHFDVRTHIVSHLYNVVNEYIRTICVIEAKILLVVMRPLVDV